MNPFKWLKKRSSKVKLIFLASREFRNALLDLAKRDGLRTADVVRRSVGLYALAAQHADSGHLLGFYVLDENTGDPVILQTIETDDAKNAAERLAKPA